MRAGKFLAVPAVSIAMITAMALAPTARADQAMAQDSSAINTQLASPTYVAPLAPSADLSINLHDGSSVFLSYEYGTPTDGVQSPGMTAYHHTTGTWIKWMKFNKRETQKLSLGSGAAAGMLAFLPPPFNAIGAGFALILSVDAGYAAIDNKCIELNEFLFIKEYSGKYCN